MKIQYIIAISLITLSFNYANCATAKGKSSLPDQEKPLYQDFLDSFDNNTIVKFPDTSFLIMKSIKPDFEYYYDVEAFNIKYNNKCFKIVPYKESNHDYLDVTKYKDCRVIPSDQLIELS